MILLGDAIQAKAAERTPAMQQETMTETPTENGFMPTDFLSQTALGLPVWGWLAIALTGIFGITLLKSKKAAKK